MDVSASLSAPCSAEVLFAHVIDLGGYPSWTDLVHRATSEANTAPPTWDVELRARVGPLARSKRLRMQRTLLDAEHHAVRFERVELDAKAPARADYEILLRYARARRDGMHAVAAYLESDDPAREKEIAAQRDIAAAALGEYQARQK